MAGLVGDYVHVPGGSVEVGQDKGLVVGHKVGAVTATPLVFPGLHVEGLGFQHEVDEFPGLLAHAVVHSLGGGEDLLLAALGGGVPLGEDQVIVVEHKGVHPQLFAHLGAQVGDQGDRCPGGRFPGRP